MAARLRRGNAAANQVSDMVEVLDAAIAALPERMRVGHSVGDDEALVEYPIWVRADCAAGPSFAAECRERNVGFSFVAQASDGIAEALSHIPVDDPRWQPALPQPKPTQHNGDGNESAGLQPGQFTDRRFQQPGASTGSSRGDRSHRPRPSLPMARQTPVDRQTQNPNTPARNDPYSTPTTRVAPLLWTVRDFVFHRVVCSYQQGGWVLLS